MDKIGWKVVKKNKGQLQSSRIERELRGWGVSYGVGKRTTGKQGTPVLAFSTRYAACNFAIGGRDLVFKAELENPRPIPRLAFWGNPREFARFWKHPEDFSWSAPDGTLACDAITLLEPA